MASNRKRKDTVRVQVAVNASPHIVLLIIELVALKLDLATHGINARRSTEKQRNHPVHHGPEERSVVALHGQRVAQQQVAHVHEETLDTTELEELACFPEHILCPWNAHRRLTARYQQDSHHLGLWDAAELNDSGMQPILAQDSTLLEVVFVVDHARDDEDLLNQIKKLLANLVEGLVVDRIKRFPRSLFVDDVELRIDLHGWIG